MELVWLLAEYKFFNKGALLAGGDEDLFEIWEALELEGSLVVMSTCRVQKGFHRILQK